MIGKSKKPKILIVGLGGIGSTLVDMLYPALEICELESEIHLLDSDIVDQRNIGHQKFSESDIGNHKVSTLVERYNSTNSKVKLFDIVYDLSESSQLESFDFVIVGVDRPLPRRLVHSHAKKWLDVRCMGDSYIAFDNTSSKEILNQLTPDHEPASCQYSNAILEKNIQFGFAMAAAHAAQWCFQSIRSYHEFETKCPPPRAISLMCGELITS